MDTKPLDLTDAELHTALAALTFARDAKLKERGTLDLLTTVLYDGDALPPVGTLDGDILRIGALLLKVQSEAMRREVESKAVKELPTTFDGDPKL